MTFTAPAVHGATRPGVSSLDKTTEPGPAMPGRFYTDPAVYDAETRGLLSRTWQLVGHELDLPDKGSRIVGRAGPGHAAPGCAPAQHTPRTRS
jgi:choline monooxygenase